MPHSQRPESRKRKKLQQGLLLRNPKSLDKAGSPERDVQGSDGDSQPDEPDKKRVRWNGKLGTTEEDIQSGYQESVESEPVQPSHSQCLDFKIDVFLFKTCVSISCSHGRLGAAFYDPLKTTLYLLEDTAETTHFDLTKMFLEQVSPDIIITGSKSDENFIQAVQEYSDSAETTFQIRPSREFNPTKGRERLLALDILFSLPRCAMSDTEPESNASEDGPRNAYEFMRSKQQSETGDPDLQRWNATVRLSNFVIIESSPCCISAAGALLDHLFRTRAMGSLEDEGISNLEIRSIEPIALEQSMHINSDALYSLQIFEDENHASIHSDKTKEGLSLFAILNSTRTALGRTLLRNWFLRPSLSLSTISSRHDALSCFLRSENLLTAGTMHGHLKGVSNIPRVFSLLRSGRAGVREWQAVVKFVYHASLLKDTTSDLHQGSYVDVVKKLLSTLDVGIFRDIGNSVNETIDWEASSNVGRVCVRPQVDEELDEWKRIFHGLDSVLLRVATQIGDTMPPEYAESLNVVYFPQLGFLICLPLRSEWKNEEGTHVPQPPNDEFIFQFCTEKSAYFKSPKMRDLDHHIGDLHPAIVDREIEIIHLLEEKVLAHEGAIKSACEVCAELDCLLSFAEASRTYDYTRPQMVEESMIDIKGGRHPLQERVVDTFVPNDTFMISGAGSGSSVQRYADLEGSDTADGRKATSIVVCTGANACGKSVYLKQTALIVYMAQIGCFVPAESAILGIVDKIFTRVQTRESVSKVQSAFMIDLNQVSLALRNMTSRSLLIIDEFGKGTVSSDGAGLFCGLLTHMLSLGASCPKVLTATHFHDLFRHDLLSPSLPVSFVHMQVLLTSSSGHILELETDVESASDGQGARLVPGESITYLYRVAPGLCLDSYAFKCALAFGIAPRIVKRAQHVSDLLSTHAVVQLLDEKMTPEEQADLEDAEAVCRRFLKWDLKTCDDKDAKGWLREILGRGGNCQED